MTTKDENDLDRLKDLMDNPLLLDENHPGWNNLLPKEKERFKNYMAAEEIGADLTPG